MSTEQRYLYGTGANPVSIATYEDGLNAHLCKAERRQLEEDIHTSSIPVIKIQKEDEGRCPKCKVGIMKVHFDEIGGVTCDKCRNTTRGRY